MDNESLPELVAVRRDKLEAWREQGAAYPNDFKPTATAGELHAQFDETSAEDLEKSKPEVAIAGRMLTQRVMGKASFAHLTDRDGPIQIFVRKNDVGEEPYNLFKKFDPGDIVGVTGRVMRTRAGELSVQADSVRLLVKCLVPPPEKWHGLTDQEARYRARHLDLSVNEESRKVFRDRARIITYIRRFLDERDFVEVETPSLQPLYGGAAARPFTTHHNAFDTSLYLRIATELYLKRCIAGGMERVYELGKNFRNEGVDTQHNPEFTALEWYQAYADYEDLMEMTEDLVSGLAEELHGSTTVTYGEHELNFAKPWARVTPEEAILATGKATAEDLATRESLAALLSRLGEKVPKHAGAGGLLMEVFDALAEKTLIQPTFLVSYPQEVSPLARRSADDPSRVDRFELFIAGREIANAFSELNDPDDQRSRFEEQAKARDLGDDEAHPVDYEFLSALEWGMPPTAGEGIGIDRLVMLLTDCHSIRDVMLFPLLRPRT